MSNDELDKILAIEEKDNSADLTVSDDAISDDSTDVETDEMDSTDVETFTVFADDYFADDESFVASEDVVIDESVNLATLKQKDGLVSWAVTGLYDSDGNLLSGKTLKLNPPILDFENSEGEKASFMLTENFVHQLSMVLKDVERGYFGLSPKRGNENTKDDDLSKIQSLIKVVKHNPIKAGVLFMFFAYVMFLLIF